MTETRLLQRPIRTEAEYDMALRRAAQLMNAAAGTSEAVELDVLARAIEAYEEIHHPIGEPDNEALVRHLAEARVMDRDAGR